MSGFMYSVNLKLDLYFNQTISTLCSVIGKMGKSAMKILGMKDEEFYEVGGRWK